MYHIGRYVLYTMYACICADFSLFRRIPHVNALMRAQKIRQLNTCPTTHKRVHTHLEATAQHTDGRSTSPANARRLVFDVLVAAF